MKRTAGVATNRGKRSRSNGGRHDGAQEVAERPENTDWRRLLPLLVIAAGLAAYANSFSGVFLFDDDRNIVDNARIQMIWPLSKVLSGPRPIVELSLAVNYALGGTEVGGYHAVNLAIHLLAGLTLFGVVRRTIARPVHDVYVRQNAPCLALAVAVVWVVHPLQTESVTYVIQRSESLMGLFYLLTLYCTIRGVDSALGYPWYVPAVLSCALGMGSKPVMVTAPLMVLIYDCVFVSRSLAVTLRRRWVLYAALWATLGVLWVTGEVPGALDPSRKGASVGFSYKGMTPATYAATQVGAMAYYLRLSFWPHPLCLDYAWPAAQTVWDVIRPALVVVPVLAATVWAIVRRHWAGFLGLWFFIILLPTSSFVPIKDPVFEHRMYLPLAAVIAGVVIGGRVLLTHLIDAGQLGRRRSGQIATVLLAVVVLLLIYGTARRNRDYQSDKIMWSAVLAQRPDSARAHLGLGTALFEEKNTVRAEEEFSAATRLRPTYADAFYNLGNALRENGKLTEAVDAYRDSLRLDSRNAKVHYNLGNVFNKQGELNDAIKEYRAAVELDPTHVAAYINMGNCLKRLDRLDKAVEQYHAALKIRPHHANAHYNLGAVYRQQGLIEDARREFELALKYDPRHTAAREALDAVKAKSDGAKPPDSLNP